MAFCEKPPGQLEPQCTSPTCLLVETGVGQGHDALVSETLWMREEGRRRAHEEDPPEELTLCLYPCPPPIGLAI